MKVYRFAPSPTGFLHVGGARTAIFNWLLAKQLNGKFLVRIEDTDTKRSSSVFTDQILNSLKWLGLDWNDSPVFQSKRKLRYIEIANQLLKEDKAYCCFCTSDELKEKRQIAEKNKSDYVYDKTCLNLSVAELEKKISEKIPYTIRLNSGEGLLVFKDKIMGKISTDIKLIGDFIIVRADGTPVYQLAVVVDDFDMGITDVIRGADHLANTPKQILLLKALNWKIPQYAHLPLILGPDKKRLSKRHGATAVNEFKKKGYLADALLNYLCLLGWSANNDKELFTKDELIRIFNLDNVNNSNAVFDEQKLKWMNAKYISQLSASSMLEYSSEFKSKKNKMDDNEVQGAIGLADLIKIRSESLIDFEERMQFYYYDPMEYNKKGIKKYFQPENIYLLELANDKFNSAVEFNSGKIEEMIRTIATELNINAAKIIHPLRLAITGNVASPGIFEIIELLGKEKVCRRINNAIQFIESNLHVSIN